MSTTWSAEVIVKAVRETLGRASAARPGLQLDDVWPERGELVIAFHWRRDPNPYAVRLPFPEGTSPESPWTGLQVSSAQEWAQDTAGLLTEELDTGAVRRARRHRQHGLVELDWDNGTERPLPGHYVSAVVLPGTLGRWEALSWLRADFGRSLSRAGLDITTPRHLHRSGRLLSWLQLCTDDASPEPVGQASIAWHAELPATATLEVLELLPGVPEAAAPYLARMGVHDAAEAGAQRVETTCSSPHLPQAGFHRPQPDGPLTLDTTALD